MFRQLIQNGLHFECSSNPREVHRLLPRLWAHLCPLVLRHPSGRPHAALRQCWHEPGILPILLPITPLHFMVSLLDLFTLLHFSYPFFFSTSQSSSTPSIPPTLWPSCVVPPTPRSVSAQEVNTTTWTMWVKMSTIIPSSRCWGPGLLGTTLRYYAVIPSYHHNDRFWRPIDQKICVTIYSLVSVLKCLAPLYL